MNEKLKVGLISGVLGAIGAATADLSAYRRAVVADRFAVFDWKLAAWRWVQGFVVSALAGGGL